MNHFSVRAFALFCVAVIAAFMMWLSNKVINTLSGPGWCATALGAGKATSTEGAVKGLDSCVSLLTIQLHSLSETALILLGTVALCLLVLVVVVIAQARLEVHKGADGGDLSIAPAATPVAVVNTPDNPVPVEPAPAPPAS